MRRTLPVFVLLALAALPAGATSPTKPPLQPVDANGDGVVTREEAQAHPRLAAQFDAADTNKDGQLDAAEMTAHREAMRATMRTHAEERWKGADQDGDGALSREEATASMPGIGRQFEKFDTNSDGKIAREEMHSFRMRDKPCGAGSP